MTFERFGAIFKVSFSSEFSCLHSHFDLLPVAVSLHSKPSSWWATNYGARGEKRSNLLLDLLPETSVLLDADLLGGVELVEAAEVHILGEQRDHVLVEGLPVRVLEVVPTEESDFAVFWRGKEFGVAHFWLPSFS
jgi:hypothetical protein